MQKLTAEKFHCRPPNLTENHPALMLADRITLLHFSASSANSLPNLTGLKAGVPFALGHPPRVRGTTDSLLVAFGYSITSSARANTLAGISKPSARAVLRLITVSNFVGCCTGKSAGLSPLRMRST